MPIDEYFGGHGAKVMQDMESRYGDKKGKSVFYATANARKKAKARAVGGKPKAKAQAAALRRSR